MPDDGRVSETSSLTQEFNPFVGAQREDPYPVYARARRDEPVFFSETLQMWYVTRYDDIVRVVRDPARFSSAQSVNAQVARTGETRRAIETSWLSLSSLTNNDPPSHTQVRRIVNAAFAKRTVARLERHVRAVAGELVDGFADDGRADLVARYAQPLPLRVILSLLGAPQEDAARHKQWSDDWIALVLAPMTVEEQAATIERLMECGRYWTALIEDRTANPGDDIVSDIARASRAEDEPVEVGRLVNACATLLLAGHETTTNLLGNCMHRLLTSPAQWRLVLDDPAGAAAAAVEETLRADSSVQALMRTTTQDVEVAGVAIPAGAQVALLFASANHDETYFSDPARFDLERRSPKAHLAFGNGIHRCLGARLARVEGRVTVELLAGRLPGLRLVADQPREWIVNPVHRGLRELRLEWEV